MQPVGQDVLSPQALRPLVRSALDEDIGEGDITTLASVPAALRARAVLVAREPLTLAGLALATLTFEELDPALALEKRARDGDRLEAGQILLELSGAARSILSGERVALNFLQHLSGIATLTAQFVHAVRGTRAQILDTRKTIPGLRALEKYAVTCGGGKNHRHGLFDAFLIKDNHRTALAEQKPNPIAAAVQRARQARPGLAVQVEADTLEQVSQALAAGADSILLDNMPPEQLRAAVELVDRRARTEASGGVSLATVRAIAESGVDCISIGALTHSARAVDIALDFHPT